MIYFSLLSVALAVVPDTPTTGGSKEQGAVRQPVPPPTPPESEPNVFTVNEHEFEVPFQFERNNHRITEIILYMKHGKNGSWKKVGSAKPSETRFKVRAPRNGLYLFAVQIRAQRNKRFPPKVQDLEPSLRVQVQVPSTALKQDPTKATGKAP